jgi:hypothetical protein
VLVAATEFRQRYGIFPLISNHSISLKNMFVFSQTGAILFVQPAAVSCHCSCFPFPVCRAFRIYFASTSLLVAPS